MSFLFINKSLWLNNLKTRTAMNAKISVLVTCVKAIIYLLLHNLHDCTFKMWFSTCNKKLINVILYCCPDKAIYIDWLTLIEKSRSSKRWSYFSQIWYKSSHHRCSVNNDVLKNFAKFTGKHLCTCENTLNIKQYLYTVQNKCQSCWSSITCSKLTIETLEQGVKYVQS